MTGAWNAEKVGVFRDAFYEFIQHVTISSKERNKMILGEHLYRAQIMFYEGIFSGLAEDIHDFYCLKSRQLGWSTGTRALSVFWLGMHDGLRGGMVFDTAFNTSAARREIEETIDNLPKRLRFPGIRVRNRDSLILENDSWLVFLNAGTKQSRAGGGLGRSFGFSFVHASEVCSWVNEEGITSFRQSLAEDNPDRLFIWESTARGYNLWHRLWQEAKDDPLTKRTMFAGWWAKDNQQFDRDSERFKVYSADQLNKKEIERIEAVRAMYGWKITPEQMAWYRWKTDPGRELDEEDAEDSNVIQEQPFTEIEAFQATGSTFFQTEKLNQALVKINASPKPQSFKFWPGQDFVDCEMLPSRTSRDVEFLIWEEPVQQSFYVVAGDPAFGHREESNNSCAQVLRCYADGIDQVGEYTSPRIEPHQFAWLLWTLVGYYGHLGSPVMMICELNGPGEEVWRQYQMTQKIVQGYHKAVAHKKGISNIFQNARTYIYGRSDSMGAGSAYQFRTQVQNKVQIMEALRNYLHTGIFTVYSPGLVEEMRSITREGDQIGADGRNRDDRAFAAALGIRAWDERIRRGLIAGNRTREADRAKMSTDIGHQWNLNNQWLLRNMFAIKEQQRMQQTRTLQRAAWRRSTRGTAPTIGRRW